ncbi:hypothetical protein [Halobacteriovorax sp. JY17]|uniref:hypothetical protein n=1 Tax=Halobacteriovorax sp. JY17 TaxID=2014617 RepID=UPI0025BD177C|nr:hypothetical protein [Halobacteriovorax sp. JY17]
MNQPLDITLMVIIILLLVLIIVLAIIAGLVFINYLKGQNTKAEKQTIEKTIDPVSAPGTGICKNHENQHSVGICAICEEEFCVNCLKQIDKVNLCPEHFNTFADNIWHPITNQRTTPDEPEHGVYIYKFKQHLWKDKGVPSYIINEYKIQVENDHIETYVQLHVKEGDRDTLTKQIEEFKGNLRDDK